MGKDKFITPEIFNNEIKKRNLQGPNGWILFVACNEGIDFAERVKREYESLLVENKSELLKDIPFLNDVSNNKRLIKRFDDTETAPRLPYHVAGSDAFVFQSVHELISGNVVNDNFMQLLQMIRTLKVHGAKTITAVTPYSPYSRQDKPTFLKREATLAKLAADLLITAGVDGVILYHPHTEGLRGFYEPQVKFTALNGLDLFISITDKLKGLEDVVCVSTDAGGAKFTIHYSDALNVDYAIGNKFRPKQEKTEMLGIIGNLQKKKIALIGDDESVTVTSLSGAVKELHERYNLDETHVLVSHNKIRPQHLYKLVEAHEKYGLKKLHVTDTVPQKGEILNLTFIETHPLARRFAETINKLHYNQSVSALFYTPR